MLRNSKAYSGFSVDDTQKARKFCGETLGLEVTDADMWFKDPAGNVLSVLEDKQGTTCFLRKEPGISVRW